MGRVGNVQSDLHRKDGGSGVRAARLLEKDIADKLKRRRVGPHSAEAAIAAAATVEEPLVIERFDSVWEALGFSAQETANLEARSALMRQIESIVKNAGWTQAAAAKHCGVSQPRLNDLLRGKVNKFSIDALVNMAGALGCRVSIELKAA